MMNKKSWILVGSVVAVLLLIGAVGAYAVYAQGPTPPGPRGWPGGPGKPGGLRQLGQAQLNAAAQSLGMTADDLASQLKSGKTLAQIAAAQGVNLKAVRQAIQATRPLMLAQPELDAAAKALGMTSADLSAELKNGKKLSDIANEKGVNLQTVQDAIQSAQKTQFAAQINQAVAAGKMTQDKANWLLEGLNKGYLNGPGAFRFGFGFGLRGQHMQGVQRPQATPSTAP
jgi:uncharacterized membrane protein